MASDLAQVVLSTSDHFHGLIILSLQCQDLLNASNSMGFSFEPHTSQSNNNHINEQTSQSHV